MAYKKKEYIYNNSLSKEENLLLDRLYKLRLSHMAEALERQFLNPNMELEGFLPRISSIINYEWDQRQTKKFNKLKTKATLKYPDADFDQSLYGFSDGKTPSFRRSGNREYGQWKPRIRSRGNRF